MEIKLSICIPTYNRANFLEQTLNNIVSQIEKNIEVIIVDGASTDNTEQIVQSFKREVSCISYVRQDRNQGVDKDILKAVEVARGEYCWLFSDDDCLEKGAIAYVLSLLSTHTQIAGLSLNIAAYDKELKFRIREVPSISQNLITENYLFVERNHCFSMLGVHFGYLSGQIIKKKLWQEVIAKNDLSAYYNCWLLVYIIGKILELNPNWLYVHDRCVSYRSGNDSFLGRFGLYNRQVIAHVAFEKVIRDLFGKTNSVYRNIVKTILTDRLPRNLAMIKANNASVIVQYKLLILYCKQYWRYPLLWIKVVPIFLIPNFFLRSVRGIYFWWSSIRNNS